jgi:cysteine desulfurase/selenocysteine lyase
MPVMQHFNVPATVRASFGIYTNRADIDQLMVGLQKTREIFA